MSVLCPEESTELISSWWQDMVCYLLREKMHRSAPSGRSKCMRTTTMSRLITTWHFCSSALLLNSLTRFSPSALLLTWRTSSSSTSATVSSQDGEAPSSKVGVKNSLILKDYNERQDDDLSFWEYLTLNPCRLLWLTQTPCWGGRYHFTIWHINLHLTWKWN